jgi:hypothetical protein
MAINFKVDSKFKDNQGRWHTQALFKECPKKSDQLDAMFTLRDKAFEGLPSIKEAFLSMEDPTGYKVATELLGGWGHWKRLCQLSWFKVHLAEWEEELEIKMKCKGIRKMIELSEGDKAVAKDATKFIVNREWESKRGRPSNAERERNSKIDLAVGSAVDNDFKLLRL